MDMIRHSTNFQWDTSNGPSAAAEVRMHSFA
jgi:hypothetical protein